MAGGQTCASSESERETFTVWRRMHGLLLLHNLLLLRFLTCVPHSQSLGRTEKSKTAWTSFWELLSTCMARCLRNGSSPITISLVQARYRENGDELRGCGVGLGYRSWDKNRALGVSHRHEDSPRACVVVCKRVNQHVIGRRALFGGGPPFGNFSKRVKKGGGLRSGLRRSLIPYRSTVCGVVGRDGMRP